MEIQEQTALAASNAKQRLAEATAELGRPPTRGEYADIGTGTVYELRNAANTTTWDETLAAFGFRNHRNPDGSVKNGFIYECLGFLRTCFGVPPTRSEYESFAPHNSRVATRRANGGWNAALEWAGFDPESREEQINRELLTEMVVGAFVIGRTPTSFELEQYGEYGINSYYYRWDEYSVAVEAAGLPEVGTELSRGEIRELADQYSIEIHPEDVPLISEDES